MLKFSYDQPLAITAGEPAGIGPDLIATLAAEKLLPGCVVIADPNLLQARAAALGKSIKLNVISKVPPAAELSAAALHVLPCKLATAAVAGVLNSANANYVLQTIELAAQGCMQGNFAAMVTCPVNKQTINQAGIKFSGHTEFIAALANVNKVVMMLATESRRVALVTTHVPLRQVADLITVENVKQTISICAQALQRNFNIARPRIKVLGLNPHAGEGGTLGTEEIDVIIPAIRQLRQQGIDVSGPYAADTAFIAENWQQFDCIIAMYHDQGLPIIKTLSFGDIVNITLGLPFIRTSVDHGTALELAATGKAKCDSLIAAIKQAQQLVSIQYEKHTLTT